MIRKLTRKQIEEIKKNNPDARIRALGNSKYKIRGLNKWLNTVGGELMSGANANANEQKLTGIFRDMVGALVSDKLQAIEDKKNEVIKLKKEFDAQIVSQKIEQKKEYEKYTTSARELISSTLVTIQSLEAKINVEKTDRAEEYKACKNRLVECENKLKRLILYFKATPG